MKKIFSYLGLEETINVNKHRVSYMYQNKYEFSFDEVEKLGLFIEIEVKNYEYEIEKEYELLFDLMEELEIDINNLEHRRYPEMIEQLNK